MRRVLVTGARGFIGRHALAPLLEAGMEVHAVSSRAVAGGADPGAEPGVSGRAGGELHWHHCDLLAPGPAAELIATVAPSELLHFAWYTRHGAYWTARENLDWVKASLRLLRAFGGAGGRRAVVAGTCAEYAWAQRAHCVEGVTPTVPATFYGAAKHALHGMACSWAREAGVELAWGRIFHVYGPDEHPDRLVASLARALLRGEDASCADGRRVRDLIYAPELGHAFAALLAAEVCGPVNMASGEPVCLAEVAATVAAAAAAVGGRLGRLDVGARAAGRGEPDSLTADVRRLREGVGWRPAVGLREGLWRSVRWWQQQLARDARGAQLRLALGEAA